MTDFLGNKLEVGDKVAFIQSRKSPDLSSGTVKGFSDHYIYLDGYSAERKLPAKVVKIFEQQADRN